jgi:hypothetical protein
MKYTILLITLIASLGLNAQDCKYEENKTDEFTKKIIIRLKKVRVFSKMWSNRMSNQFIDLRLIRSDDFKFLYLVLTEVGGSRLECFNENDILYIKQKNDSIIKLQNLSIECGNYQSGPEGYYYILSFNLYDENIEALKLSPIVKIRLSVIEGEIKESAQNYFIDNLKCLE